MKIIQTKTKTELLKYREDIENFFFQIFERPLLGEIWDWAYLSNPNGEPIVTMCFDGNDMVGHYAIVPMPLKNRFRRKNSYLAMTTMVARSHTKFGLFRILAEKTYKTSLDSGIDFVMGFPNNQASPGLRKRLHWHLPESDYVALINRSTLAELIAKNYFYKKDLFSLDFCDTSIREWRTSRPGGTYQWRNGVAYKEYQGSIDLIWWRDQDAVSTIPDGRDINVLVTANSGLEKNRLFDYQFGGISLCSEFDPATISREMAISDIF